MVYHRLNSPRCSVEGCKNFVVHGEEYCSSHLRQYQNNLAVGDPNPRPTHLARRSRKCWARNCKAVAVPFSNYCPLHSAQYLTPGGPIAGITDEFTALMARLQDDPPDSVSGIQQELALLKKVRRLVAAYTESSSRSGWKTISLVSFTRLWLATTEAATELLKVLAVAESTQEQQDADSAITPEDLAWVEQMPGVRQLMDSSHGYQPWNSVLPLPQAATIPPLEQAGEDEQEDGPAADEQPAGP